MSKGKLVEPTVTRTACRWRRYFSNLLLLVVIWATGCESPASYKGVPWYHKVANGSSNLKQDYAKPPVLGREGKSVFSYLAEQYLEGVKADLETIEKKAENAQEKIRMVATAANIGHGVFHVPYLGDIGPVGRRASNFPFSVHVGNYPQFPDFRAPIPQPYDGDTVWKEMYRRQLQDFAATIQAYIEDGNHYVENCKNDHETVRKQGVEFLNYLNQLKASGL